MLLRAWSRLGGRFLRPSPFPLAPCTLAALQPSGSSAPPVPALAGGWAGWQPGRGVAASPVATAGKGSRRRRRERRRRRGGDGPAPEEEATEVWPDADPLPAPAVAELLTRGPASEDVAALRARHPVARLLEDHEHPLRDSDISRPAWGVLMRLRSAGHEVLLVGGTVRDILLGRTPKDVDILTSASPRQVRRLFSRCYVVGRAFPICHVHHEGTLVEVSSFHTNADASRIPPDAAALTAGRHKALPKAGAKDLAAPTWSDARRDNALRRDFTSNGLLYDPFSRIIYDYVGGVQDCHRRVLRTIGDPVDSFRQDPARILRAVRLAARAGLELDNDTAAALVSEAPLVASLPQGRLTMELGALLGYGGAARSLELLWRHGLLHLLLPQHAAYLKAKRTARDYRRRRRPEPLFDLLRAADAHVHPQQPLDPAVWLALLAAPLVAKECAALVARSQGKAQRAQQQPLQRAEHTQASLHSLSELLVDLLAEEEAAQQLTPPGASSTQGTAKEAVPAGGSSARGRTSAKEEGSGLWGGVSRRMYLAAYHEVVQRVLDRLVLPLDAATLRALGLAEQEAALRQAAACEALLQPVDVQEETDPAAAQSRRERRKARRRERRQTEEASDVAATVLVPSALPKAAMAKAAGLLLLEAELRGRPLPPPANRHKQQHQPEEGAGKQQEAEHRHHGRQHGTRKLSPAERLLVMVLRQFDWHEQARLPPGPPPAHRSGA